MNEILFFGRRSRERATRSARMPILRRISKRRVTNSFLPSRSLCYSLASARMAFDRVLSARGTPLKITRDRAGERRQWRIAEARSLRDRREIEEVAASCKMLPRKGPYVVIVYRAWSFDATANARLKYLEIT